jgi:hypothetical protein
MGNHASSTLLALARYGGLRLPAALARAIAAGCGPIGILDLAKYWRFLPTEASVTVRILRVHSRIVEHTVETSVERDDTH